MFKNRVIGIKKLFNNLRIRVLQVLRKFNALSRLRKCYCIGFAILILISIMTLLLLLTGPVVKPIVTKAKSQTAVAMITNPIGSELNDIAVKLANIEARLSKRQRVINIDPIRQQIAGITQQTRNLAKQSQTLIAQQIKTSTKALQAQLQTIKMEIKKLQRQRKQLTYLNPSQLPFQILAINNIQEQNVVTVRYNHVIFPITAGESLADWKLAQADFANQTAEFVNPKQQHIRIDLNREGISKDRNPS